MPSTPRPRALLLGALLTLVVGLGVLPGVAAAASPGLDDVTDQWLPRSDGAEWTWAWSDSDYQPTPRKERYVVAARNGTSFRLKWDEVDPAPFDTPTAGTIDFKTSDAGLVNLNYQSTQPPSQFPILCASANGCGNSTIGPMYMLIWGTRSPVLAEPLLRGTRWSSLGGADNDVASTNRYAGREKVTVPAFPAGIEAAKVESVITQAGAIGDPYGSGVRTVWWVRGVGPVKIVFRHAGGEISQAELQTTNVKPLPLPPDANLLPLNRGETATLRWRNSKHMKRWSSQRFSVAQVVNNTSRVDVKHLKGPIRVAGGYVFSTRLDGVRHLSGTTKAASKARFPRLGPRAGDRRTFFTPYDLMVYGFGPVVPIDPVKGESWRSSRDSPDWSIFGVSGDSRVIAIGRRVKTPSGTYKATVIRSRLTQRGFPFGSGTRTSWFAPGKGLVKLVFRHADGSVSTVQRTG